MRTVSFSETRTTSGIKVQSDSHFFFSGVGRRRRNYNDGQPQVLLAVRSTEVSGRLFGTVKVTSLAQTFGTWFSLREVGNGGTKTTVYLRWDSLVVVDGMEYTLRDFYKKFSA